MYVQQPHDHVSSAICCVTAGHIGKLKTVKSLLSFNNQTLHTPVFFSMAYLIFDGGILRWINWICTINCHWINPYPITIAGTVDIVPLNSHPFPRTPKVLGLHLQLEIWVYRVKVTEKTASYYISGTRDSLKKHWIIHTHQC